MSSVEEIPEIPSEDQEEEYVGEPIQPGEDIVLEDCPFVWSQTLKEAVIKYQVPSGTRGKDISVKATKTGIKIGNKSGDVWVEGDFKDKVKWDEVEWSIEDGVLEIEIPKNSKISWWSQVLEGFPEINTKRMEAEKSKLQDLDEDTQFVVRKMMFDQQAKERGAPTSEILKQEQALAKFKEKHPDVNFSNSGGMGGGMGFPQ